MSALRTDQLLALAAVGGLTYAWSQGMLQSHHVRSEMDQHVRPPCHSRGVGPIFPEPWWERSHESAFVEGSSIDDVRNLQRQRLVQRQIEHPGVSIGQAAVLRG